MAVTIMIKGITPRKPEEPWPIIPGRIISEFFCCGKIAEDKDEALRTAMITPIIAASWGFLTKALLLALRDYDHMYWTETWDKRDISEIFQESYFSSVVLMAVTCCVCLVCNYSHYKLNQLHGYVYYSKGTERFMVYPGALAVLFLFGLCVMTLHGKWSGLYFPHMMCAMGCFANFSLYFVGIAILLVKNFVCNTSLRKDMWKYFLERSFPLKVLQCLSLIYQFTIPIVMMVCLNMWWSAKAEFRAKHGQYPSDVFNPCMQQEGYKPAPDVSEYHGARYEWIAVACIYLWYLGFAPVFYLMQS